MRRLSFRHEKVSNIRIDRKPCPFKHPELSSFSAPSAIPSFITARGLGCCQQLCQGASLRLLRDQRTTVPSGLRFQTKYGISQRCTVPFGQDDVGKKHTQLCDPFEKKSASLNRRPRETYRNSIILRNSPIAKCLEKSVSWKRKAVHAITSYLTLHKCCCRAAAATALGGVLRSTLLLLANHILEGMPFS